MFFGRSLGSFNQLGLTPSFLGLPELLGLQRPYEMRNRDRPVANPDQQIIQRLAVEVLEQQAQMPALEQAAEIDIILLQLPLADLTAKFQRSFLLLTPEILTDTGTRPAGLDQLQPGSTGVLIFLGEDLNDITALQLVLE